MAKPAHCHGNSHIGYRHAKGCRPGRPLCAAMRRVRESRRPCGCERYHFPHRKGSGNCRNEFWPFDSADEFREQCRALHQAVA